MSMRRSKTCYETFRITAMLDFWVLIPLTLSFFVSLLWEWLFLEMFGDFNNLLCFL